MPSKLIQIVYCSIYVISYFCDVYTDEIHFDYEIAELYCGFRI